MIDHVITESVIHVDQRMSYTGVQKILDGDEAALAEYEVLIPMIRDMKELAASPACKEKEERFHRL